MKKLIISGAILLGFAFVAHATVGGPTHVYDIRAAANLGQDVKEIIYVEQSGSGKGCPPEIYSLNISTGAKTNLVHCDDPKHEENFKATLAKYPTKLYRVHLPYNQIEAEVKVTKETPYDPNTFMGKKTDFVMNVFQNKKPLAVMAYSGCNRDQVHILEGYAYPSGPLVALLVSTVGDCFEQGYTFERLYPVVGAQITYDYPQTPRAENSPAIIDASKESGNLLLIASTVTPIATTTATATPLSAESQINFYRIAVGILAVMLIIILLRRR